MNILTLPNPAAWLIAAGHKTYLIRDGATRYRGRLEIAALKPSRGEALGLPWRVAELLTATGYQSALELPAEVIVATVELLDCERVPIRRDAPAWFDQLPADELNLDDFTPRRYVWHLKLIERLDPPRPWAPSPEEAKPAASNTTVAALKSIDANSSRLRKTVYDDIDRQGPHGATCDEVQQRTGIRMSTCSARITELKATADVMESGETRPTSSGRPAAVLVTLKHAHRANRPAKQGSFLGDH